MEAITTTDASVAHLRHETLTGLPEPVRRYFAHAVDDGAALPARMHLTMKGRIHVGRWLDFEAEQTIGASGFLWHAQAGLGRVKPLDVYDEYWAGGGVSEGLLGPLRLFHAAGIDVDRAAAVRGAIERIWCPGALLPGQGVSWRAPHEDLIVATMSVPPEETNVTLGISPTGAVTTVAAPRWGRLDGKGTKGYVPFGGFVEAERRFGSFVLPSVVTVGWWFGSPEFTPFFEATISDAVPAYLDH